MRRECTAELSDLNKFALSLQQPWQSENWPMYPLLHSFKPCETGCCIRTALTGMYNKCGLLEEGLRVFASMEEKNLHSRTIMISGFADHGWGKDAVALLYQLEERGLKPDSVLFFAVLSACSHASLVEEDLNIFRRMVSAYKVKPMMEHYGCMVDMFGSAGEIGVSSDVEGKLMEMLIKEEPGLGANYVLSANLAASSGKWSDVVELRSRAVERGLKKVPGCSWVEVGRRSGGSVSKECNVTGIGR